MDETLHIAKFLCGLVGTENPSYLYKNPICNLSKNNHVWAAQQLLVLKKKKDNLDI